jgi:hypothetical protein
MIWFSGSKEGGAILVDTFNDNILLDQNIFEFNTALDGGAVSFRESNTDLYIYNSSFLDNSATGSFGGGGILMRDFNAMHMSNCLFARDVSMNGFGGGIFMSNGNSLSMVNSSFNDNTATAGGAISVDTYNYIQFTADRFVNNKADTGGALFASYKNELFFYRNMFVDNAATNGEGGAFKVETNNYDIMLEECIIIGNTATVAGGGVHSALHNSGLRVYNCDFIRNFSPYGGGVYFGADHEDIVIASSFFDENRATDGGGVFVARFNEDIVIHSNRFTSNNITGCGAALVLRADNVTLYNCSFEDNVADQGGAVCYVGNHFTFHNCTSVHNHATSGGGSIFLLGGSDVAITASSFVRNSGRTGGAVSTSSTSLITIKNCDILDGSATDGGGVYVSSGQGLLIKKVKLSGNVAKLHGGGVYIKGVTGATYIDVITTNNVAAYGGGLFVFDSDTVAVNSSIFQSNTAIGDNVPSGSAVWASEVQAMSVHGNFFDDNHADSGRGTVYWEFEDATMIEPAGLTTDNTFSESNTASYGATW